MPGSLFIVATPIGNLEDMSPRAVSTLQSVDYIAAEDTRHSAKLLSHFHIETRTVSYHEHNEDSQGERILAWLAQGKNVALISDAGTPLVSDPGYRLVAEAHKAGISVVPLPGASAMVAALSVAGLPSSHFYFEGFLPSRSQARRNRLQSLSARSETLIFYESPHRVAETLQDMAEVLGSRAASICRELTKTFETVHQDTLEGLVQWVQADDNQRKGEIVLVVSGAEKRSDGLDEDTQRWLAALADELSPSQAAAVAAKVTGLKKRELYNWLQEGKA